jgi:F0F1-type ATP synthase alpha subunit
MQIKPDEITSILKSRIEGLDAGQADLTEVGTVLSVADGIARIHGLENCMSFEMLELPHDVTGLALNLESDNVGVVLFGPWGHIKEGDTVKRTNRLLEIPVGDELLGRIIDPLGNALDGKGDLNLEERRSAEFKAPGVVQRQPVKEPLQTGIKAIDAMIPIGRGQRELIIGDRQTGKTAIAIDAIINNKDSGIVSIYVAIGQRMATVVGVAQILEEAGAMDSTIIVAAAADEAAPIKFLAPYAGAAIGEHFLWQGRHALTVYDDLTKHAYAYRQMSLLLRRPPGREAYPGDVFYLHSRLLERACKLNDELAPMKKVAGRMKGELSQFRDLEAFAQFGSDLDEDTQRTLARGERLVATLNQGERQPVPIAEQVAIIYAATNGYIDRVSIDRVPDFHEQMVGRLRSEASDLLEAIAGGDWSDETQSRLDDIVKEFADDFGYDLDEDGKPVDEEVDVDRSRSRDGRRGDENGDGDGDGREGEREGEPAAAAAG